MEIKLSSGDLQITYTFDPASGLARAALINTAGPRSVTYSAGGQPLWPFGTEKYTPGAWTLERAGFSENISGGLPVTAWEAVASTAEARLRLCVTPYPGASVIREQIIVENIALPGGESDGLAPVPLRLGFVEDDRFDTYKAVTFRGGMADYDHGMANETALGVKPRINVASTAHHDYVPLVLFEREGGPRDGLMAALDYDGSFTITLERREGAVRLDFGIDPGRLWLPAAGETAELPSAIFAAYAGDRDEFMRLIYDWQYRWLWDRTNPDLFARPKMLLRWVWNNRNLHEQFAMRLAFLDMQAGLAQEAGFEMLWDDAGWSAHPSDWPPDHSDVFFPSCEGPDFRHTQRYLQKCGLGWVLWFSRKHPLGLMEAKQNAWGPFEFRTDAISVGNIRTAAAYRRLLGEFLDNDPRRSYHTCSGGGTFCHSFGMQSLGTYHYEADIGAGPAGNYYFSYFEVPDKTGDLQCAFGPKYLARDGRSVLPAEQVAESDISYVPEFARARLGCVPLPGPMMAPADVEAARVDLEIYRFLRRSGVAGRGCYVHHQVVFGDREYYYMQRTSGDRVRACVILRRTPRSPVTLFPRGLLPELSYHVSFQNRRDIFARTGADLMENGIRLERVADGELIFLNLPDHPAAVKAAVEAAAAAAVPPAPPGAAVSRLELNNGHIGMGVYWSPSPADESISYYEVLRNGGRIARVSRGNYFFDFRQGWDPGADYQVRAVGISGAGGPTTAAKPIPGEPLAFSALGGILSEPGFNGWSFATSADLSDFVPMKWVPPEKDPAGDLGGTPNQPGGEEGWWEGAGTCARAGRGWQQASPDVYCARIFTASTAGRVRVTGRAMKEYYHSDKGSALRARIMHNDRVVWPSEPAGWANLPKGDLFGASHDITLDLTPGDRVIFIIDKDPAGSPASMPWDTDAGIAGWIPLIEYLRPASASPASATHIDHDPRSGDARDASFSCRVPAAPGIYTVQLTLADPESKWRDERLFDVSVNGAIADKGLDIVARTKGPGRTLVRAYNYVVPGADGMISVDLRGTAGASPVRALDIAPEDRSRIRVNCGSSDDYIDWLGLVWAADSEHPGADPTGCRRIVAAPDAKVAHANPTLYDQALYRTGLAGKRIAYAIPVRPGIYSVLLKFAEIWLDEPGKRPVTVSVNGAPVRSGWDCASAAGRVGMAFDLRFDNIVPAPDGKIAVSITADGELPAIIQGVEID